MHGRQARHDLLNTRILRPGVPVHPLQQFDLRRIIQRGEGIDGRIQSLGSSARPGLQAATLSLPGNRTGGV